jgi:hypothetical protein
MDRSQQLANQSHGIKREDDVSGPIGKRLNMETKFTRSVIGSCKYYLKVQFLAERKHNVSPKQ